jgi:phosphoglycolate phosphatase-like HAD superfamily hydrolase
VGEDGGLVVGFDLDMTLIDTSAGFVATIDALAAELGV